MYNILLRFNTSVNPLIQPQHTGYPPKPEKPNTQSRENAMSPARVLGSKRSRVLPGMAKEMIASSRVRVQAMRRARLLASSRSRDLLLPLIARLHACLLRDIAKSRCRDMARMMSRVVALSRSRECGIECDVMGRDRNLASTPGGVVALWRYRVIAIMVKRKFVEKYSYSSFGGCVRVALGAFFIGSSRYRDLAAFAT